MPAFSLDNVLACLDLQESSLGTFTGANLELDYHRVFGGQILGQTIRAASAAAADGKVIKSLTQLFPREGDSAQPMTYAVTRHQEGRTYASTGVVATQGEKVVSLATISLHTPEPGDGHQASMPSAGTPEEATLIDLGMIPWETRIVGGVSLGSPSAGPAELQVWMKAPSLPADESIHQALLAHATDLTLIGTALRPVEGLSQADATVKYHSAVTSHSLWFHAPVRVDDWLLL
ncbi:MAG: acyl-CoA thioesterase, partial [Frankiales bacterium]|nr:acyl-CoA thioesterase [Frankiales bacterium]